MATKYETAKQIWVYLTGRGWTEQAVAGVLGNMESESGIIADRWESDIIGNMLGGYGLVQWTPATKYIDWARSNGLVYQDVISQCKRLEWEVDNNQQFYHPYMTFRQFIQSKDSPEVLADIFIRYYERPYNPNQPIRQMQARYWYEQFKGQDLSNYYTSNPGFVRIIKDDYYYSSLVFDVGNRVESLKSGIIVKIDRVDFTAEGIPRLKCSKGYISANKVFVERQSMEHYITENPKFVRVIKDDYYYNSLIFDAGNRSGSLKTGIIVKIDQLEYSSEGIPRLKCSKGYISANKAFVEPQNMEQYITENPGYIRVVKDDYYYSSLTFEPQNRLETLTNGSVIKIDQVAYSAEGIPRLRCDKGYISANKTFVTQAKYGKTTTSNGRKAKMECIFWMGNDAFYYNGVTYKHLHSDSRVELMKKIYREVNGLEIPEIRLTQEEGPLLHDVCLMNKGIHYD